MGWGMFAGQAVKMGINLLGKNKGEEQAGPSYTDSGWKSPPTPSPGLHEVQKMQPDEPATEAEGPKSFMEKVNQGMGSNVGKAASQIVGNFIGDAMQQRQSKKNFKRLRGEGLTSQEIVGSGGGTIQSQGNTLGSGPATQLKSQQEFMSEQAMLDRKNRREVAEIGARAAGGRLQIEQKRAPLDRERLRVDTEKLRVELERDKTLYDNLFEFKLAGMSSENVITSLTVAAQGVDIASALRGNATPAQIKKIENVINTLISLKGPGGGLLSLANVAKQLGTAGSLMNQGDGWPLLGDMVKGPARAGKKFYDYQKKGGLVGKAYDKMKGDKK